MLPILQWRLLSAAERQEALRRPAQHSQTQTLATVQRIIEQVRTEGDRALLQLTRELDRVVLSQLAVDAAEFDAAQTALTQKQRDALDRAIANVRQFHEAQRLPTLKVQ